MIQPLLETLLNVVSTMSTQEMLSGDRQAIHHGVNAKTILMPYALEAEEFLTGALYRRGLKSAVRFPG